VREFIEIAAEQLGMGIEWRGKGVDEVGIDKASGNTIVEVDSRYFRPTEVETLLGDPSKAKSVLGWERKVSFRELVEEMVNSDHEAAKKYAMIKRAGYQTHDHNE
jgi:GDPmannose 4,6-dehydratase